MTVADREEKREANGEGAWDPFPISSHGLRANNPLRKIVDTLTIPPTSKDKPMIPLSIGDPTTFGNLKTPQIFIDALCESIKSHSNHGYANSAGTPEARSAIATRYSYPGVKVDLEDVIIASGCSGAIDIAFKAVASEGDNIILPNPGFPLYQCLAKSSNIDVRFYDLIPSRNWEVDLESLRSQINERTRAIVINNPSNPCGNVFSKEHLLDIVAVAQEYGLPIIADEIYGAIVFGKNEFHPLCTLTSTVPILTVGGIAKEFLVPGFRIGWIIKHDNRNGTLRNVWNGALKLTTLILGANTIVQPALKSILAPEPGTKEEIELLEFNKETTKELEENAKFLTKFLDSVKGLKTVQPQGAMYMMLQIEVSEFDNTISDDIDFANKLLEEETVFVLPDSALA
eukprot:CAMPEP_0184028082 /NCGR_PEP_ID=MMETSP0954-20121128/14599_1 /TAXON_ID=627963 /ORGANISM="Aplanochytrium sp, Strain PBS07" /LENGTH=399 /DNA_ID=CAMNT_0026312799 /DNA_START=2676 /DNA_END=3876 /DNA_ORIENTATION=+